MWVLEERAELTVLLRTALTVVDHNLDLLLLSVAVVVVEELLHLLAVTIVMVLLVVLVVVVLAAVVQELLDKAMPVQLVRPEEHLVVVAQEA
jgi:hypothetical protein